ncbi:MAG: alpha/beta hydrolase [Bryobacteraceae bacterium]|nr:alpha/beta hydrolase [Bryobacteraceae bacterium]
MGTIPALQYRFVSRAAALIILVTLLPASGIVSAAEPAIVSLWPQGAPGSEAKSSEEVTRIAQPNGDRVVSGVHKPSITVYLPSGAVKSRAGVVIAPGGGHRELWTDHEGHNVAKWLSEHGVAGFVLKYRLAREKDSTYTIEGASLDDTQRAIRVVKSRAQEWGIEPERIGVMGFSAGGELAALAAVRSTGTNSQPKDEVDKLSARPAFQALIYPAIPAGAQPSKEMPPAFLACGENDRLNISQGLPELYLAMKKAGMSAELHVYGKAGHGFGLRPQVKSPVQEWVQRFHEWLDVQGFLANK